MTPMLILIGMLVTSSAGTDAFQFQVSSPSYARRTSSFVLGYKKGSTQHEEHHHHHPQLKQGENVLESTINRVLKEDIDCPLLKHREELTSSSSSSSKPEERGYGSRIGETRTVIVPSTIDSLPSELVDMNTFKSDMKVQARMRVPSFNAQGYKSSIVSDLKHDQQQQQEPSASKQKKKNERLQTSHHDVVSLKPPDHQTSSVLRGHSVLLWLQQQLSRAYKFIARKSRLLASHLAKVDWSPLLQWVVLAMVLHLMCYHDIRPSARQFHLLW